MTVVFPLSTLSNNKPSYISRKERTVFTNVAAVAGLTGILFVYVHSCSTSASGIHELNERM